MPRRKRAWLAIDSVEQYRNWYKSTLNEKLVCISHERQAYWSEAIAVGNPDWLQTSAREAGFKRFAIKKNLNEDKKSYIYFLAGKNCFKTVLGRIK